MHTNNKNIKPVAQVWAQLLTQQNEALSVNLSELEKSALSSWVQDCFHSFEKIYVDYLEKIKNVSPEDYDSLHDCVVDIYWQLDHIKNHISDSEKGFLELMNILAKLAEIKEKS